MSESTGAIAALGGFFALMIAGGPVMLLIIGRQLPWGISRRLQKGRKSITRRTMYAGGAWNPAKPLGRGNSTPNEPGWATYTLTSDGLVRLDLVRADGRREQFEGPPVEPPAGLARSRRLGLVPSFGYLASTAIGFALGYGLTTGRTSGRVQAGMLGALGGWAVAWFAVTVGAAILHARMHRSHVDPGDHS